MRILLPGGFHLTQRLKVPVGIDMTQQAFLSLPRVVWRVLRAGRGRCRGHHAGHRRRGGPEFAGRGLRLWSIRKRSQSIWSSAPQKGLATNDVDTIL